MDQLEFLVIMKDSATVRTTLMERPVTHARRIITISHFARAVTVIQLELSRNLLVVDQFQLVNCVNVKNAFKEEFAINVDHFIGI
jgi:hypothetical protein